MKLYRTIQGIVVEENANFYRVDTQDWNSLLRDPHL